MLPHAMCLAGNMTIRPSVRNLNGAAGKRLKIKLASELGNEKQNSTLLLLRAVNISAGKSKEN